MKTEINKSVKRAISLVLAFVLLIGTLFTANVGVNIKAGAETEGTNPYADWNIQYWDGTVLSDFSSFSVVDGKYVIDTAAKLQFACSATKAEYWRDDSTHTFGKSFVIDSSIDAFIMQPESVITALGGPAAVIELSGAEETRKFFEETYTATGKTPVNWSTNTNNGIFAGNFDGSGVGIYGIYADGAANNIQNVGFFPMTEGSSTQEGTSTSTPTTDTTGTDIENLVIKNCYFKGFRRVGILSGGGWYNGGGMLVDGCVNVDSCVVANCYVLGQNYISSTNALYATTMTVGEMGLLGGSMDHDPVKLSNSLVYGNKTEYDLYTANSSGGYDVATTTDAFKWLFKSNKYASASTGINGSIKDCVILDAQVTNLIEDSTTYCENVYSNVATTYTTVTNIIDAASAKGAHGRYYMSALGWDSAWWAIENDYPTPFKPSDSYVSVAAKEFEGSGTETDPYLIYCAKHLDVMVSEGGIRNGVRAHYKVADGVKEIYINDVKTREEAVALYASGAVGTFNNWLHGTTAFEGSFDGNSVTIYGMISSNRGSLGSGNVGFVPTLGTQEDAATKKSVTIKNINFMGAYVNSTESAAVVSSNVVNYKVTTADGNAFDEASATWGSNDIKHNSYISNVSVRESYIYSNKGGTYLNSDLPYNYGTAAGILSINETPDHVVISNCLFDGASCELADTDSAAGSSSAKSGIVSMRGTDNEISVNNCVSIGEHAIPMVDGITYARYKDSAHEFNTVYGKLLSNEFKSAHSKLATYYDIADATTFTMLDMPLLNWGGAWTLETLADGRTIPMPKTSGKIIDSYSQQLANQNDGKGANQPNNERVGGYTSGTYGMYEEFLGSGTEEDPYIISDALGLARAIACGGKDITTKLYYKLACDIDVGASWLNTQTVAGKYVYVPFEGTLDGDGHTIYNLYSVSESNQQGLIPKIADGAKIKNLHIRDSYICSGGETADYTPGALFGSYVGDVGKVYIEGCSYESDNEGNVRFIVSDFSRSETTNSYSACKNNGETKYRYYESCYWDSEVGALAGTFTDDKRAEYQDYVPTPENAEFYTGDNADTAVWYKGGKDDCKPQLVNRAKAMTAVDISGYGDNDYDTNDIASLRQRLLGNTAYANVYGDVSRNGVTNLGDLAILTRQLVGTYNMYADGFWRNAALGNIVIYYGENDNYDFARKLELALEDAFGKDVKKVVVGEGLNVSWGSSSGGLYVHKNDIYYDATNGNYYDLSVNETTGAITPNGPFTVADNPEYAKYALDGNCQIVVGNIPSTDYATNSINFVKTDTAEACDQYGITYDKANSVVWLQGGSFTAVEQATLDFIKYSNPDSSYVYTTNGAVALDSNKVAKDIDGDDEADYFYAWGDEFNSGSLHKDSWNYDGMQNETGEGEDSNFANLETAFPDDIEKLYTVNDGKLTIWRGYYADAENANATWGYKWLGTLADKGIAAEDDEENDLYTSRPNLFGGNVDVDDTYVTAGKICTNKSMLVKQGYLEMKASYPQDGHAFACWWLLGHNGTLDNKTLSNSLYGKVFKLNNIAAYGENGDADNAWDGTNTLNSSVPSTFKYQLPNSSYEIDIVELMQGGDNAKFSYKTANFTFHKFYRNGVYTNTDGAKAIKFINWNELLTGGDAHYSLTFDKGYKENYSWLTYKNTTEIDITPTTVTEFLYEGTVTRSGNTASGYTYNTYNGEMKGYNDSTSWFSSNVGTVDVEGGQEYIFGVKWDATDANKPLYTFTVHVANEDGSKGDSILKDSDGNTIESITVADNITYNEDENGGVNTFLSKVSNLESDQATANQYMYMLIDNTYYTALNGSVYGTDDMLTQNNGTSEVATMEIDYVRVYQQKRDIVTPDTEEFNNGNHFGY